MFAYIKVRFHLFMHRAYMGLYDRTSYEYSGVRINLRMCALKHERAIF